MPLTIFGLSKTYSNGVQALKDLNLTIGNNMFGRLTRYEQEGLGPIHLQFLEYAKHRAAPATSAASKPRNGISTNDSSCYRYLSAQITVRIGDFTAK